MTITQDDRDDRLNSDEKRETDDNEDKYIPTAAENVNVVKKLDDKYSDEYDEIQSRAASGRAVTLSKNLSIYLLQLRI